MNFATRGGARPTPGQMLLMQSKFALQMESAHDPVHVTHFCIHGIICISCPKIATLGVMSGDLEHCHAGSSDDHA